jgi:hypothetical protein
MSVVRTSRYHGGKEGNAPIRQALSFFPRRPVGAAAALGRIELRATESILVRPAAVNARRRQLAFATHARTAA